MTMPGMTRGERTELGSLIRKREKVMKSQAQERSAALLAEFDAQSAKIYHYDDDPVWAKVESEAKAAVEAALSKKRRSPKSNVSALRLRPR
jgi:hypothetical protein